VLMPVVVGGRELVVEPSVPVAGGEGEVGVGVEIFTTTDVVGVGVGLAVTVEWVVVVAATVSLLLHQNDQNDQDPIQGSKGLDC